MYKTVNQRALNSFYLNKNDLLDIEFEPDSMKPTISDNFCLTAL